MLRNDDLVRGVAIGVGIAVLVPLAIVTLAPIVKPLARSAMKAGIRAYEKGRESLEEFGETVDDIIAEVEEEMIDEHQAAEVVMEAAEAGEPSAVSGVSGRES